MNDVFAVLTPEQRKKLKKSQMPSWVNPMLATLTKHYFSDSHWIFEEKFDGVRIIAYCNGNKVHIYTRNKISANARYPEIVEALQKQNLKCVLDGEVVAFGKNKITHFELLQKRAENKNTKIYYCIFDIMYANGYDTTKLPLLERKEILREIIPSNNKTLLYTPHKVKKGEEYRKAACKKGWEGVMAKRAESTYQQKRSRDWLKFKCVNEQELVIGGFTKPRNSRVGFGALLLGYYEKGKLKYAGKVGTGFDTALLKTLHKKMAALEIKKCPFAHDEALPENNVHWVKPTLVAQIGFEEWTSANKLRQGRFLGLRTDKKAKDVVQEVPK